MGLTWIFLIAFASVWLVFVVGVLAVLWWCGSAHFWDVEEEPDTD